MFFFHTPFLTIVSGVREGQASQFVVMVSLKRASHCHPSVSFSNKTPKPKAAINGSSATKLNHLPPKDKRENTSRNQMNDTANRHTTAHACRVKRAIQSHEMEDDSDQTESAP